MNSRTCERLDADESAPRLSHSLEATFRTSWDEVEQAYRGDVDYDHMPEMLVFVQQLRAKGYDRTFRAGRSMGNLILSRSRANHLRPDQPSIGFVLSGDGRMHVSYRNRPVLDAPSIALTSDIERLLSALASEPIT